MESQNISIAEAPARQKIPDQEARLVAALFEAFRSGEDRDGLVRHCHSQVIGYFRQNSLGIDPNAAEDLAQQVWIIVLKKYDQLRDPYAFRSWLQTIISRTAINGWQRGHHRRSDVSLDVGFSHPVSREHSPSRSLIIQDHRAHVKAALGRLCAMDCDTLTAFYFRNQSLKEMAESFSVPIGSIKRRLHVARKRLRKELMKCVPDEQEWASNQQ